MRLPDSVLVRDDHPPAGIPFSVYFDGVDVTTRLPRAEINVSATPSAREIRIMLSVYSSDIEFDPERQTVKVLDWYVLTPVWDEYDLPAKLAAAEPDGTVEVVIQTARVIFGGTAPE